MTLKQETKVLRRIERSLAKHLVVLIRNDASSFCNAESADSRYCTCDDISKLLRDFCVRLVRK